jgi:predicted RNA-binding protein Jag
MTEIANYPDTIKEISEKFFSLLGISIDAVEVAPEEEKRRIYRVAVKTPESKLLIGVHGQTLEHLRHLLTRLVERTVGKSFLLHLEINDYLQAKDDRLYRRVEERLASLLRNGGEVALDMELSSYDRKKIHSYVADKGIEGLATKSVGEGTGRTLHLIYTGTPVAAPAASEAPARPSSGYVAHMDGSDLSEDGVGI